MVTYKSIIPALAALAALPLSSPAVAYPQCSAFYKQYGTLTGWQYGFRVTNAIVYTNGGGGGINFNGFQGGISGSIIHYCSSFNAGAWNMGNWSWIVDSAFIDDCAPASGPNLHAASWSAARGVDVEGITGFFARNLLLVNPGTGIFLDNATHPMLNGIEVTNVRGSPFGSGNAVAFIDTQHGSLTNFYVYDGPAGSGDPSLPEDLISNYESTGTTIAGGVIDGANSPTGSCIQADLSSTDMNVSNVQCLHALNQCFGAYGASGVYNIEYSYVGCSHMIVSPNERGAGASSGQVPFVGGVSGAGWVGFENATYFDIPSGQVSVGVIALLQAAENDAPPMPAFTFRPPCQ